MIQTENKEKKRIKFPFYKLTGTHKEIGIQYGEHCKDLIEKHLVSVKQKLGVGTKVSLDEITDAALQYQPYVQKYMPFLDEEIQGMARGAKISLGEAYLLQVRAEMNRHVQALNECTTFAVAAESTKDGIALAGQNVDLPSFYGDIGVVLEIIPNDGPKLLMFTPAGQISHIGINNLGMAVFANAITSDGWGEGLPRYMFSRLALTCETVEDALQKLNNVKRSSARNIIMMDKQGNIADFENTPKKDAVLRATDGMLAHTNHYVAEELLTEERSKGSSLINSQTRLARMNQLLAKNKNEINRERIMDFFRDRENFPNCICRMMGDESVLDSENSHADTITCASVIGIPSEGQLLAAIGPPNNYEYFSYKFSN